MSPSAHLISVVFPAPFFPSSPTTDPRGIDKSSPSSTTRSLYRLMTLDICIGNSLMMILLQERPKLGQDLWRGEVQLFGGNRDLFQQRRDCRPAVLAVA